MSTSLHEPPNMQNVENWDDDFLPNSNSPSRRPSKASDAISTPNRARWSANTASFDESWDDDDNTTSKDTSTSVEPSTSRSWGDEEDDKFDENDISIGKGTSTEGDKTMTNATLTIPTQALQPPFPLTPSPPTSPTLSAFSIPVSYSSTAHLALRPTLSEGSSALGLPLPAPRPRRRLRKKSRPPLVGEEIFELDPVKESTPPPQPEPGPSTPPPPQPPASPPPVAPTPSRGPLLSRMGSLKRWAKSKQSDPGSPELASSPPSRGWSFRPQSPEQSSSPEVTRNKSRERFRFFGSPSGYPTPSPPPHEAAVLKKPPPFGPAVQLPTEDEPLSPTMRARTVSASRFKGKRPISMLPQADKATAPRQSASVGRSTINPLYASRNEPDEPSRLGLLGFRRFSNTVVPRKEHGRNKSAGADSLASIYDEPPPPLPSIPATAPVLPPIPVAAPLSTPAPPTASPTASVPPLLPPIELSPPSPPRVVKSPSSPLVVPPSTSAPSMATSASLLRSSPVIHNSPNSSPSKQLVSASLGRANGAPLSSVIGASAHGVPRRNSLGDLKIPARISQAQMGLKRDLGMVREFALCVEQLKQLQTLYRTQLSKLHSALEDPTTRATSPLTVPRPPSRPALHYTNLNDSPPDVALTRALKHLDITYGLWWECAELLIELGGGSTAPNDTDNPEPPGLVASDSGPASSQAVETEQAKEVVKSRERAVTLAGNQNPPFPAAPGPLTASSPNFKSRSTGRHDLSARQLALLKEILVGANAGEPTQTTFEMMLQKRARDRVLPPHPTRNIAAASAVTLPSSEASSSSQYQSAYQLPMSPPRQGKIRRASRVGINGIRELLKSLKKGYSDSQTSTTPPPSLPPHPQDSSASSSVDDHFLPPPPPPDRAAAKSSTGAETIVSMKTEDRSHVSHATVPTQQKSPRRPSLASLFRLGQGNKHKEKGKGRTRGKSVSSKNEVTKVKPPGQSTTEEDGDAYSDWDRMDSASDLDVAARALDEREDKGKATIKVKKSFIGNSTPSNSTPQRTPSASQTSLAIASPRKKKDRVPSRSNSRPGFEQPPPIPQPASAPPAAPSALPNTPSDPKLALTPENIRPLLECAREINTRLNECLAELNGLGATVLVR